MKETLTEDELRSRIVGLCYDLTGAFNEEVLDSDEIGATYSGHGFHLREQNQHVHINRTADDSFLIEIHTAWTRHGILYLVADPDTQSSDAIWTAGYLKTWRRYVFPLSNWILFRRRLLVTSPMMQLTAHNYEHICALHNRLLEWQAEHQRQTNQIKRDKAELQENEL